MALSPLQRELFDRSRTESLSTEIKSRMDLASEEGISVLIKACQAIYNRNGGHLLIGFNDDGTPAPLGTDELNRFSTDAVQDLISKYSSPKFEVDLDFLELDGKKFPIISVPSGVRAPVYTCKEIKSADGKVHLKRDTIYFRTLSGNGRASTAALMPKDFPDLLDVCFRNRETDIASFVRRHLSDLVGINQSGTQSFSSKLSEAIAQLDQKANFALESSGVKLEKWLLERALTLRLVALCDPPLEATSLRGNDWLSAMYSSNPNLTGWPILMDTRNFSDDSSRPRANEQGWNVLLPFSAWDQPGFEFYRIEASGRLLFRRVLQDDTTENVKPGAFLDPVLLILRISEAIIVSLAMLKAAGATENHTVHFRFLLSGLSGRTLSSWANPGRFIRGRTATDDSAQADLSLSAMSESPQISSATLDLSRTLLFAFDGFELAHSVVDDLITKLIERRL